MPMPWINPALRAHEEEFRQAWQARFGSASEPPKSTYKAWYKQFKRTGMAPSEWIATVATGPPASSAV